jgi:hypothetical protein
VDIECRKCGEPWDIDSLHEAADEQGIEYREVARAFRARGCVALGWGGECEPDPADERPDLSAIRRAQVGALYDMLGDDMDGAAAMLEDLTY